MAIRNVTIDDCGGLEGTDITPLYSALKTVCTGLESEAIWEHIRERHHLGIADRDCNSWVTRMNSAIAIWNTSNPKDCASVRAAYGV